MKNDQPSMLSELNSIRLAIQSRMRNAQAAAHALRTGIEQNALTKDKMLGLVICIELNLSEVDQ